MTSFLKGVEKDDCPLVIVFWEDSRQPEGSWRYLADMPDPSPVSCASVGWLVKDGPDCQSLCPNMGDLDSANPQGLGAISIPNTCVVKISRLEEATSSGLSGRHTGAEHEDNDKEEMG